MSKKNDAMNDFVNLVVLVGCQDRCQHLEPNGKRCKRYATLRRCYHGDNELYGGDDSGWVTVQLCEKHGRPTFDAPKDLSHLDHIVFKQKG